MDNLSLATSIDKAMKSHKGTITEVPKAELRVDVVASDPYGTSPTATLKARFYDGIHSVREYRLRQNEKALVVKDDFANKHSNIESAGGRFHSKLKVTWHRHNVELNVDFLIAHKSSLWPVTTGFSQHPHQL